MQAYLLIFEIAPPFMQHGMAAFPLAAWLRTDGFSLDAGSLLSISVIFILAFMLMRIRRIRMQLEHKTTALEKSETHLRTVADNLNDIAIFQLVHDPETDRYHFSFISEGFDRIIGIDRSQFMDDARLALELISENDFPQLEQALIAANQRLEPANMEIRLLDSDGEYKWLHISAMPQAVAQKLVWDGFMMDISTRKKAEQTLTEESQNLQNLFETIDDFLLVCDMDGQLLHANPALGKRLGYSYKELCGMTVFELYPKEDRTSIYRMVNQLHSEPSITCDLSLQTRSGESIMVEMNLFQGTWKQKKSIFGVARDVARFQQTEDALRKSQRTLQLIIDSIPLSIFWKDKDSTYLGCNRAFLQECRLEHIDDVVGKTPFDLFDRSVAEDIIGRDHDVLCSNEALMSHSESHTLPHGTVGWREVSLIPMHDEAGNATGVLGVWRDVTERKQAEERLKRTLDDMERFNQLMRGRERRTLELKDEINDLLLELGRSKKYRTTANDSPS